MATAEQWAGKNPILPMGVIGIVSNPNPALIVIKVGDGHTPWNNLPSYPNVDALGESVIVQNQVSAATIYSVLGYTPEAKVEATEDGAIITLVDKDGTTSVRLYGVTDAERAAWNAKYTKPATGIPAADLASGVIPDVTGKADKVTGANNGHFAGLDSNGNLTDSGKGASDFGTYSKPSGGIPKTDLASAVQTSLGNADTALQSFTETDPTVPSWAKASSKPSYDYSEIGNTPSLATVATSGSYNDLSNKPSIPSAPGTLNTDNATAQSVNSSEALSGTVKLHKVSKTGNYNDLLNKPTIPSLNMLIVAVGYDSDEDEYIITNNVTFSDICDAYEAGKGLLLVYTDEDDYASEYTLSDYAADDDYISFAASFEPEKVKSFSIGSDDSVSYSEQVGRTSALTNDSLFVRGQAAIWKGICATSASTAAKFVPLTSFTADDQVVGVMVVVTFSNTNAAATNNLTLNVQSRGAKPIKRLVNGGLADIDKPENLTGTMAFIFDGTNWVTWYESFDDVDGNCLDAKFGNVTLKQWKPDYTMTDGSYVKGADGLLYEYAGAKYVEVPVGDAERVRFLGLYPKYSSWTNGWAFGKYVNGEWVTIESEKFDYDTSLDASYTKEYIKDVPSGATHFRTSSASSSLYALERQFYLYFQTGKPAVSQEELEDAVNPTIGTTQPSGGFLPNKVYDLGTLTGTVTFALASPTDNTRPNPYHFTFDTGSTAPTITWPSGITWAGGSAPTINATSHYEIMVRKGYGTSLEFDISGR